MADSALSSENGESRDYVRALARGLQVIECFDETNAELTLSDVAKRTGLTRPSARRALLTLQTLGYASADGNRFTLTARTLRLGYAYLRTYGLTFEGFAGGDPVFQRAVFEIKVEWFAVSADGSDAFGRGGESR